jgi:alkanesulfonate monooxygenase SsuD/methylene tetrahydromethanopterin reductase-like flavin-dependent oxidoreductase (luciferase family)
LSAGRVRLGVGVGWQEAEYVALGHDYRRRGRQMDEAMRLLRSCWTDERIDQQGEAFHADAIAMEPKPPQGGSLPIWVGGSGPAALRRTGELGDGWMGMIAGSDEEVRNAIATIRSHAADAGRDPAALGMQAMLAPPPNDRGGKDFYGDLGRVVERAEHVRDLGFDWLAVNATAVFQAGARSIDGMIDALDRLHTALRGAVG